MPYDQVMHKFSVGALHSGGPNGPRVRTRRQAIAIMLSEKRKAEEGKEEYQPGTGKSRLHRVLHGG
jgi:hypothetical protein